VPIPSLRQGYRKKEKSTDIELFDLLLDTWIQALSVDVGLDIFQMIDVFSKSIIWYKDIFHRAPHKGIIA